MTNNDFARVRMARAASDPSRATLTVTVTPESAASQLQWSKTGEGFDIFPNGLTCEVVGNQNFTGVSTHGTITATIPTSDSVIGSSDSCSVDISKLMAQLTPSGVGAPGGYLVKVPQGADSYTRRWKLNAGSVAPGSTCDSAGGWTDLPSDGVIAAQAGTLSVVDVDSSSVAARGGVCTLADSPNLTWYGDYTEEHIYTRVNDDGSLHVHLDAELPQWVPLQMTVPDTWLQDGSTYTYVLNQPPSEDVRLRWGTITTDFIAYVRPWGNHYVKSFTVSNPNHENLIFTIDRQSETLREVDFDLYLQLIEGNHEETDIIPPEFATWKPGRIISNDPPVTSISLMAANPLSLL